ncbi:MAG: hypothetical protein M1812_005889 [Candelaria pacifica]|nr:MAG: hypothetical protein M1812_005889 [Candelaria pacifica]
MASSKPTIAFFGATGGCTNTALTLALQANYHCSALVRTPTKLTAMLEANGITSTTISSNLTITQGDIKDVTTVQKALLPNNTLVDTIIFGVGGTPTFKPNPLRPGITDPTICEDGSRTVISALKQIFASPEAVQSGTKKPLMAVISTTGISKGKRDIPIAMIPLYHWMLGPAHADKSAMENIMISTTTTTTTTTSTSEGDKNNPLRGFIAIRPSLLTDGKMEASEKVRAGMEDVYGKVVDSDKSPVLGYFISRKNVGGWIFEQVVERRGEGWVGRMVSLSY